MGLLCLLSLEGFTCDGGLVLVSSLNFILFLFIYFYNIDFPFLYLFIYLWLRRVLVVACGIFIEACGIFRCGVRASLSLVVACGFSL